MTGNTTEFDKRILPSYRWQRPFSDPGCSASDSNFFDFLWSLYSAGQTPRIHYVLAKLGDNLIPSALCRVIRKTPNFNLPTCLVLNSTDPRLTGTILGRTLRPARTLYREALYIGTYERPLLSEANDMIKEQGLFSSIIQTMRMVALIPDDTFINNVENFSNWVNSERTFHVQKTWGNN